MQGISVKMKSIEEVSALVNCDVIVLLEYCDEV